MRCVAVVALLSLLVGCGARNEDGSTTTASSASCVDVVVIDGEQWTSWRLSQPLNRPVSGPVIRAEPLDCNDNLAPGDSTTESSGQDLPPKLLKRIEGIPDGLALFDPKNEDYVYVHVGPNVVDQESLPARVVELLVSG